MQIGIASIIYDPIGSVFFHDAVISGSEDLGRRTTKAQILDGTGVAMMDRGFFPGDAEWTVTWTNLSARTTAQRFIEIHPEVRVCVRAGVFRAAPLRYRESGRRSELVLSILKREA